MLSVTYYKKDDKGDIVEIHHASDFFETLGIRAYPIKNRLKMKHGKSWIVTNKRKSRSFVKLLTYKARWISGLLVEVTTSLPYGSVNDDTQKKKSLVAALLLPIQGGMGLEVF